MMAPPWPRRNKVSESLEREHLKSIEHSLPESQAHQSKDIPLGFQETPHTNQDSDGTVSLPKDGQDERHQQAMRPAASEGKAESGQRPQVAERRPDEKEAARQSRTGTESGYSLPEDNSEEAKI